MAGTINTTSSVVAIAGVLAVGLLASQARAEGARAVVRDVPAGQFFVDCWIGMKRGDQPGQLIRGWICERPFTPASKTEPVASASDPPSALKQEDVAAR
jgi:hypothetical protein